MQPEQLDPTAESAGTPLVQWLGRRYGGEANARRMFAHVTEVGRDEGLVMDFDRAVKADLAAARELGITGVPTFVFDGRYAVSGAQDVATFRDILSVLDSESETVA